jgi:hypothetical protein
MFTITIDLSNSAWENRAEVARELMRIARLIELGHAMPGECGIVRDNNGNSSGQWAWSIVTQ